MIPIITAFEQSPDRGRGLARDMRVRWALTRLNADAHQRAFSPPAVAGSLAVAKAVLHNCELLWQ